ncbi:hypothetical protein ACX0HA_09985 [Flavobacterium hauense]
MKAKALFIISLFSLCAYAQPKIPTEQEAREYFETEHKTTYVTTYFEEDGEFFDFYSRKNPGDIIITGTEIYKVIGTKFVTLYECSLIMFDEKKQSAAEIELLQKTIISQYNFGVPLQQLGEKYGLPESYAPEISIDYENLSDGPLKKALEEHSPNEIFLISFLNQISYLMVINNNPTKQKSVSVQQAVYE